MSGIVVFDDTSVPEARETESERSFVLLDSTRDVAVVDAETGREIIDLEETVDFIVLDAPIRTGEILVGEPELVLLDAPADIEVLDPEGAPAPLVLQSGGVKGDKGDPGDPSTIPGPPGPAGPQGDPGAGTWYQEYYFASPLTTWTCVHNQNTFGVEIDTVDLNGDPIEGLERTVDENTVEIDWYYPTAGTARLFR